MADQGLLGQAKPAGTTNTVLYSAPVNQSASAVLTIANDGTGAAYDVAIKDFDQKLTFLMHQHINCMKEISSVGIDLRLILLSVVMMV